MKNVIFVLLPLALAVCASAGPPTSDDKDIQGTWVPAKAELGGQAMTGDFLTNTVMKLENGNYLVTVAGSPDKGTYTIAASAKPKTIDITGTNGPNAGKKFPGIYELQGNTLKICYGLDGSGTRPAEFKSPPGTLIFLVTYERKKS